MVDEKTRINFGENSAQREEVTGKGRPDLISPFALMRLGKWTEEGAIKYGVRNWEDGMPFNRYTQSIMRHLVKWMANDTTEDHLAAIMWNAMGIIHHQELGESEKWDDMPKYNSIDKQIGS